jgi:hypothetical protein
VILEVILMVPIPVVGNLALFVVVYFVFLVMVFREGVDKDKVAKVFRSRSLVVVVIVLLASDGGGGGRSWFLILQLQLLRVPRNVVEPRLMKEYDGGEGILAVFLGLDLKRVCEMPIKAVSYVPEELGINI